MLKKLTSAFLLLAFASGAIASKPAGDQDPLHAVNHAMYTFNSGFDHLILKPVAQLYLDVAPQPMVTGVSNIYNNLSTLPTVGNDVLQANFHQAFVDTSRFLLNSTLGIFGLFDVASMVGIPENAEDMGLTFARWGWKSSTFVVLPFFGPSTIRDSLGKPIDYYMTVYPYVKDANFRNSLYAMGVVNTRANLLQLQGVISQAALDPYVFERNAYLQRRNYLIKRNHELDDAHYDAVNMAKHSGKPVHPILPLTPNKTLIL